MPYAPTQRNQVAAYLHRGITDGVEAVLRGFDERRRNQMSRDEAVAFLDETGYMRGKDAAKMSLGELSGLARGQEARRRQALDEVTMANIVAEMERREARERREEHTRQSRRLTYEELGDLLMERQKQQGPPTAAGRRLEDLIPADVLRAAAKHRYDGPVRDLNEIYEMIRPSLEKEKEQSGFTPQGGYLDFDGFRMPYMTCLPIRRWGWALLTPRLAGTGVQKQRPLKVPSRRAKRMMASGMRRRRRCAAATIQKPARSKRCHEGDRSAGRGRGRRMGVPDRDVR